MLASHDHVLSAGYFDAEVALLWLQLDCADRGIDRPCKSDGVSQIKPMIVVSIAHEQDIVVSTGKLGDCIPDRSLASCDLADLGRGAALESFIHPQPCIVVK